MNAQADMRDFIRNSVINEESKVKTGPAAQAAEGGDPDMVLSDWVALGEAKHVFGLAEYMPLADDSGGIVVSDDQGPDVKKLAASMQTDFNKQAWASGLDEGLNKLKVRKTRLLAPFYTKNDHFAKTGSGQT
jgi:hypothetical protein